MHPTIQRTDARGRWARAPHTRQLKDRQPRNRALLGTTLMVAWLLLSGCGQTGAPVPPSLALPEPVTDLAAARVDNRVTLRWTMPRRTTDKLLLKGPQPVHICRKIGDGPCLEVANVSLPPEKPASYNDILPADLSTGPARLLTYFIQVRSRHGRSAGESNPAFTAAGAAPPPFTGFRGEIQADGVLLQWQPAPLTGDDPKVRIQRTLLSTPNPAKPDARSNSPLGPNSSNTPVKEQTLVVRMTGDKDAGNALDSDAAFDQRYSYRVSRTATVALAGKSVEVEGPASPEIAVDTRDVFPPRPPSDLAAVSVPEEGAIDLSWSPNTEPDLAGYAAYRSENGAPSQRISGAKPLDTPAFRDQTAQAGHEYAYTVTALDRDGNESAHSTEAKEALPPKP